MASLAPKEEISNNSTGMEANAVEFASSLCLGVSQFLSGGMSCGGSSGRWVAQSEQLLKTVGHNTLI